MFAARKGVPGVAQDHAVQDARAYPLASSISRIQFTPDLLPSDVTGTYILDRKTNDFVLRKGPIFCQILLADEINLRPRPKRSRRSWRRCKNIRDDRRRDVAVVAAVMVFATQNPVSRKSQICDRSPRSRFCYGSMMGLTRRRRHEYADAKPCHSQSRIRLDGCQPSLHAG